jgi:hypothetical protein
MSSPGIEGGRAPQAHAVARPGRDDGGSYGDGLSDDPGILAIHHYL